MSNICSCSSSRIIKAGKSSFVAMFCWFVKEYLMSLSLYTCTCCCNTSMGWGLSRGVLYSSTIRNLMTDFPTKTCTKSCCMHWPISVLNYSALIILSGASVQKVKMPFCNWVMPLKYACQSVVPLSHGFQRCNIALRSALTGVFKDHDKRESVILDWRNFDPYKYWFLLN